MVSGLTLLLKVRQVLNRVWRPLIIAAAVSACCVSLILTRPVLFVDLENKAFDVLSSGLDKHSPTNKVSIVDIDEISLAKVGRWPWPRDVLAAIVRRLTDCGASVIAVDLVFSDPDAVPARDKALASLLGRTHAVLGYDFVFDSARSHPSACSYNPQSLMPVSSVNPIATPEASALVCDIAVYRAPGVEMGFLNSVRDRDGNIRRIPTLVSFKAELYPSFPLAASIAFDDWSPRVVAKTDLNTPVLQFNGRQIQLNERSELLLNYRGVRHSIPYHSAVQVLQGRAPAEAFLNKLVVIGSSASRMDETLESASDRALPDVEVQATAMDNLLAGDFFSHPDWAKEVELASVYVAAGITVWLLFSFSAPVGVCSSLALAVVIWVVSQLIMGVQALFISPVGAISACLGTLTLCTARTFLTQDREGRRSQEELAVANRFITGALGAMTAVRDVETGQHVVRIQGYLRSLCHEVAGRNRYSRYLTLEMIDLMVQLAPIHDIGKVGVPDYILRKPGMLTADEFEHMKSHVTLGKRILEEAREHSGLRNEVFFQTAMDIVYSHHEWWNGSGYPLGLAGDAIPIPGRLLAVADVYDALISKRHYKAEFLHAEAVERIRLGSGSHFDPEIVDAFLAVQDDWRQMAEAHGDNPTFTAVAK